MKTIKKFLPFVVVGLVTLAAWAELSRPYGKVRGKVAGLFSKAA